MQVHMCCFAYARLGRIYIIHRDYVAHLHIARTRAHNGLFYLDCIWQSKRCGRARVRASAHSPRVRIWRQSYVVAALGRPPPERPHKNRIETRTKH